MKDKPIFYNYDLKNDNGALKAKMLRLIMQNKLLKGEKVEELSEEEKIDQRLKIVIPRFRIKGNLNDVFSLVEKLSLKMDPNEKYGEPHAHDRMARGVSQAGDWLHWLRVMGVIICKMGVIIRKNGCHNP